MVEKNPLGPVGHQVRQNVERLRTEQRLSKTDLSDRTRLAGRTIPPLGVARLEAGTRRVDADDLVALAAVLGVTPTELLSAPGSQHVRGDGHRSVSLTEELLSAVRDVADPAPAADVPARARTARRLMAQLALELDEITDNTVHPTTTTGV